MRRVAVSLALITPVLAAALASPAAATAPSLGCANSATVLSGRVARLGHITLDSNGKLSVQQIPVRGLNRHGYYVTGAPSAVSFQGLRFHVDRETIFQLTCGGGPGDAVLRDAVMNITMGGASVSFGPGGAGGLATNEGYLDPYAGRPQTFRISRIPKGNPTLEQVLTSPSPPQFGTTIGTQTAGAKRGAYMNITPYVGDKAGQCHQAHATRLISRALDRAHDRYTGTATYAGLASFSPRP